MEGMQIVPALKNVQAQYVEMMVPLYSYGCERKIKKALSQFNGIYSVHVDYKLQKVTVWGICNRDDLLATIRNKRREARFWDSSEAGQDLTLENSTTQSEPQKRKKGKRGIKFVRQYWF